MNLAGLAWRNLRRRPVRTGLSILGIALALRMQAPIYVSDKIVLEETVTDKKAEAEDVDRFRKFIEEMKPSDFKE